MGGSADELRRGGDPVRCEREPDDLPGLHDDVAGAAADGGDRQWEYAVVFIR